MVRGKSMIIAIIMIVLLSFFGCAEFNTSDEEGYSRLHSGSGISGRPYEEIAGELKQLASTYSDVATSLTYGKSLRGTDLTMIRIRKNGNFKKRQGVLITGTIHGDEFLNIEDRLPRWFLENQQDNGVAKFLDSGGVLWIAPILNPDGYAARQRGNRSGKDLNRDFDLKALNKSGFTQPETKFLVSALESELQSQNAALSLTFDYHCCFGGVLYPWGWSKTKQIPENEKREHLRVGSLMLKHFPTYRIGRGWDLLKYVAVGTSDDFYHERFGATAFTWEGVSYREKDKFAQHTRMWSDLLSDQATKALSQGNQAPDTQQPKVAVLKSSPNGILLAVSGSLDTSVVTICHDGVAICGESESLVKFSFAYSRGARNIFQASSELNVSISSTFDVHTYDMNLKPRGFKKVKLSRQ